ncbi:MAG: asparagine synthase (glutamine-hydrolyzing) [Opitutaceae bacterium]|nr:asparagine synthase (glutamine-hydrolyzing) [Verrucomicrobiales bacterium]
MCAIVGLFNLNASAAPQEIALRRMLGMVRHRGPDQFGIYLDDSVGLGNARLSIIDLGGGQQPITNEDGNLWIVFNGEIFNYVELRSELEARGHRFSTHTDTEVILHLFEEEGPACLNRFNGQFAIAIWDVREKTLFLARDRLGVRPLFYTQVDGQILFASEIKALFADERVGREIDFVALEQVFTFWGPLSPRTVFKNVSEIPPGHYALASHGELKIEPYWKVDFNQRGESSSQLSDQAARRHVDEFRELLIDATRIRLRSDVPVGAYLSGGLDSSTIAAIIRRYTPNRLTTFSIAFSDTDYDESLFQRQMAGHLGTDHQVIEATHAEIGQIFPEVLWHTEVPLMRTSPAPMFLLSRLVHQSGYKVVLTGEGADEFLCGYDIFKESKVRRFWARQPDSTRRPLLLQKLYQDIGRLSRSKGAFLTAFFKERLTDVDCPWYSHLIRWRNNRRTCRFFSKEVRAVAGNSAEDHLRSMELPAGFRGWGNVEKDQYWEIAIFLSQYLLSSQGDRVAMAHSVEGRFPFLDYRVVEYANRLPSKMKLRGLHDKYILRQVARDWLPAEITQRPKRPYRAPIHKSFFGVPNADYVEEVLSERSVTAAGMFEPKAVGEFVRRLKAGSILGETDDMALAGILSTQLLYRRFVTGFETSAPVADNDDVKVCRGGNLASGR